MISIVPGVVIALSHQNGQKKNKPMTRDLLIMPLQCGFKSQPVHRQNAQEMTMGEKRNVAFFATNLRDDSVRPGSHLINCLAVRTRVGPDAPIRNFFPYLPGRNPFVVPVIPFHQIRNQFDTIP